MGFKDKVVVVTGSSSGIGREIALEFGKEGATVIVNGRNEAAIERVVAEIKNNGGVALGIRADVTQKKEVENLFETVIEKYGTVDILVNNAGGGGDAKKVEDITEEEWDTVVNRNLKSVFFCTQAVIGTLKKQKKGRIINISSQAGRALTILAGPHYASAKAGVISFTKQVAKDLAKYNVTVNAVAPGIIASGDRLDNAWNSFSEEDRDGFLNDIPVGRLGINSEVAHVVLFLASEEAGYIVGATIDVNGGRWML
ncbi:MAG: SDR family NAD(P)-dependent oxidoreductase [Clostridium sp.]|uniref:SDR family NAD(P)-dependent oxidoreductase n=1 Tax=Clostridium sp. TaxID=1506 RepID=UPI0039EAD6F4